MEKKIKLVMNKDKGIEISVNDISKCTIAENARQISAKTIYELIDFKIGDELSVSTENEEKLDEPVLTFFKELFEDICKRINEINANDDEELLKQVAKD